VFVPTAFITGISGQFYKQFALTIASATVISCMVSLTLSPAMAALVLRPRPEHPEPAKGWRRPLQLFGERFNTGFSRLSERYGRLTTGTVSRSRPIAWARDGGCACLFPPPPPPPPGPGCSRNTSLGT